MQFAFEQWWDKSNCASTSSITSRRTLNSVTSYQGLQYNKHINISKTGKNSSTPHTPTENTHNAYL